MSSGLDSYYHDMQEDFIKSEERKKQIEEVRNSEWLKRYKELEDKFKEWEEYQYLKNKINYSTNTLEYNFKLDEDIHGIINKKE